MSPPTVEAAPPALPTAASALENDLVLTLERVIPHYHRVLRRAVAVVEGEERLIFPQLRCLQAIAHAGGLTYAAQLARTLLVTPPTITRTLDALVERGLVERRADPASRRQVALVLTPAGVTLVTRYEAAIHTHLQELLHPLPPARQERLLLALQDLGSLLSDSPAPAENA